MAVIVVTSSASERLGRLDVAVGGGDERLRRRAFGNAMTAGSRPSSAWRGRSSFSCVVVSGGSRSNARRGAWLVTRNSTLPIRAAADEPPVDRGVPAERRVAGSVELDELAAAPLDCIAIGM